MILFGTIKREVGVSCAKNSTKLRQGLSGLAVFKDCTTGLLSFVHIISLQRKNQRHIYIFCDKEDRKSYVAYSWKLDPSSLVSSYVIAVISVRTILWAILILQGLWYRFSLSAIEKNQSSFASKPSHEYTVH